MAMPTASFTARSIARWVATALIVVTQFGYAAAGLVAAGALLGRRSWAGKPLWLWAGLITVTGGMAPVVRGGAGAAVGLVAAVAIAAIAALVMWLASR
jgi:hypothetical protein